jgi:hypothetical protein
MRPDPRPFGFSVPAAGHLAMAVGLATLYFASTETSKLVFYRHWGPMASRANAQ